ncbi:hypothetical protein [Sphingobium sp.]|uniref:hypothetical protein n=1 Tax=Sphingobium sp. TaxID=1912891 RepID=UPI0026381079|nr:hypothetical protein [Sphingobium sp.]
MNISLGEKFVFLCSTSDCSRKAKRLQFRPMSIGVTPRAAIQNNTEHPVDFDLLIPTIFHDFNARICPSPIKQITPKYSSPGWFSSCIDKASPPRASMGETGERQGEHPARRRCARIMSSQVCDARDAGFREEVPPLIMKDNVVILRALN